MVRTYDSSRRKASARRTRESIVRAAVEMHGKGITTLAPVAEAAGVSLPTLYKHFPRREDLFTACTSHLADNLDYPDPEELRSIPDAAQRLRAIVEAACSLNETTLGQAWTGYHLADESKAMADAIEAYEGFIANLAQAISGVHAKSPATGASADLAAALLGPLTYRAARVRAGLDPESIADRLTAALSGLFDNQPSSE